jgi:hypothetical protein
MRKKYLACHAIICTFSHLTMPSSPASKSSLSLCEEEVGADEEGGVWAQHFEWGSHAQKRLACNVMFCTFSDLTR